jgi:hypothetical protein
LFRKADMVASLFPEQTGKVVTYETVISTVKKKAAEQDWVQSQNGHKGRPESAGQTPPQGPS